MAESACLMHPFSYASGFNNEANKVSPRKLKLKKPIFFPFLFDMVSNSND